MAEKSSSSHESGYVDDPKQESKTQPQSTESSARRESKASTIARETRSPTVENILSEKMITSKAFFRHNSSQAQHPTNHEVRKRKNELPLVPYSSGSNSDDTDIPDSAKPSADLCDRNPTNLGVIQSPAAASATPIGEMGNCMENILGDELELVNGKDDGLESHEGIEVVRPRLLTSVDTEVNVGGGSVKDVRKRAEEKRRRMLETHGCQTAQGHHIRKKGSLLESKTVNQPDYVDHVSRPTPKRRINTSVPDSTSTSSEENVPKVLSSTVIPASAPVVPAQTSVPPAQTGCCPDITWSNHPRNFRGNNAPRVAINMAEISPGSVFDSHCHLDFCSNRLSREGIKDVDSLKTMLAMDGEGMKVYDSVEKTGKFGGCIANFCDPNSWQSRNVCEDVRRADREAGVYIAIGCHPHFGDRLVSDWRRQLERLVSGETKLKKLVAFGEMGLDYSGKNNVDKERQKEVFKAQLEVALKYNLPVVLHIREAEEDGYKVLEEVGVPKNYPLHRHCFNGDLKQAQMWATRYPGSMIGLTGLVTYSNTLHLQEVAKWIPLERLLLETDAPYFLPRGVDRSEYSWSFSLPGHVIFTAASIATLKGEALADVLAANARNVENIYGVTKEGIVKKKVSRKSSYGSKEARENKSGRRNRKLSSDFYLKIESVNGKGNSSHNSSVVNFVSEDQFLDESGSYLGDSTASSVPNSPVIQSSKARFLK